jgi:hypothetical protein
VTEAGAALLGALIGAAGGVAGGAFAAYASLRSSQIAARAPLAVALYEMSYAIIGLRDAREVTSGKEHDEYLEGRERFEGKWNELATQQKVLCPSRRIEALVGLVRHTCLKMPERPLAERLTVAGQVMDKITKMVSEHSRSAFCWQATRAEVRIVNEWLASKEGQTLAPGLREWLAERPRSN